MPLAELQGGMPRRCYINLLAPNIPFLEVILQKPCNTHEHEYLEKLLLLLNYKC